MWPSRVRGPFSWKGCVVAMRQVVLASGKRATVSDEWIARWPEDIREVLDDAPRVKSSKPSAARSKKSAATKPPQKPAPEVPGNNNSSVDEKKET